MATKKIVDLTEGTTLASGDTLPFYDLSAAKTYKLTLNTLFSYINGLFASIFAPISNGVTNGDSHNHNGGDGAQIDHTTLSNVGTNTHSTIDTFIASKGAASGLAPLDSSSKVDSYVTDATTSAKGKVQLSTTTPSALGTASAGAGTTAALADHVHPTTGMVKNADYFLGSGVPPINILPTFQYRPGREDLPSSLTFSRSTVGYIVNKFTKMESISSDTLRINYDGSDGTILGALLEPSSTNLITNSEQIGSWTRVGASVTVDATTAPDGNVTADMIVEDTSTGGHSIYKSVASVTAGTTYTFSVFAKMGTRSVVSLTLYESTTILTYFNLSTGTIISGSGTIKNMGNGWYKCSVPFTSTTTTIYARMYLNDGSSNSYAGNGSNGLYLWGAQVEASSYPSSYIPTTSAAVTRSADILTKSVSSTWFNSNGGTLYIHGKTPIGMGTDQYVALFDDGTSSNKIYIARSSTGIVHCYILSGGSTICDLSMGTVANETLFKLAFSWSSSGYLASLNGAAVVTSSYSAIPTGLTTFRIGENVTSTYQWGGTILNIVYFPVALSSSNLITLTS